MRVVVGAVAGVVIAVAFGLLVAWAAEEVPVVAWFLVAAALVGLVQVLLQLTRARGAVEIATTLAPLAVATVVALGIAWATDSDDETTAADAVTSQTTSTLAPNPGDTSVPTSTGSTGVTTPAETTSTAAVPPDITLVPDAPDDCAGCAPGNELLGAAVDGNVVHVALGPRSTGSDNVMRIWSSNVALPVVELTRSGGAWTSSDPGASIREYGDQMSVELAIAPGEIAVSTDGDRVPEVGTIATGDSEQPAPAAGPVAATVQQEIAEAQRSIGTLEGDRRELAMAILLRQVRTASAAFDLTWDDPSVRGDSVLIAVDGGLLRQDIVEGTEILNSLIVGPDEILTCNADTGTLTCTAVDTISIPVLSVNAVIREPDAFAVAEVAPRTVLDREARCFVISSTPEGGPAAGEICFWDDGTVVYIHNDRTQATVQLRTLDATVDPSVFDPPS